MAHSNTGSRFYSCKIKIQCREAISNAEGTGCPNARSSCPLWPPRKQTGCSDNKERYTYM